jgi:hypothetical protein
MPGCSSATLTRDARARRACCFPPAWPGYVVGVALAFVSAPLSLLVYGLVAVFYIFPWLPEAPAPEYGAQDQPVG